MNEQEAIKELRGSYELHQCEWAKKCLDVIQAESEKKDKTINSQNGTINALQEAIKERTEERDRKDNILTKKNKMIDNMSKTIQLICVTPSLAKYQWKRICKCKNDSELYKCEDKLCEECTREYFERKV